MIDGIYMHHLIQAAGPLIVGGRVEKIYHPEEKLLVFKIKGAGKEYPRLLVSLDPSFCTVHPGTLNPDNPDQPSTFCMILRKHLEGGEVVGLRQQGYERLVDIAIESYNDLGIKTRKVLHLELMGKYSNVILEENGIILDALYKYPIGINGFREVLPKRIYAPPPTNQQRSPDDLTGAELAALLPEEPALSLRAFLQSNLQGFSKKSLQSILDRCGAGETTIEGLDSQRLEELLSCIRKLASIPPLPPSELLAETDRIFNSWYLSQRMQHGKSRLMQAALRQSRKLRKKEGIYLQKVREAETGEDLRIKGEILSANLYRLKGNLPEVTLENYYLPDHPPLRIPLEEAYSPAVNVRRYFKRYHKIMEGKKQSEKLLAELQGEIEYLDSVMNSIEQATLKEDLQEIQTELENQGLLKTRQGKRKKEPPLNILKIELPDEAVLLIGKNNRQNDRITFKEASGNDYWFHVKEGPGAHVLLKNAGREPDEELLRLAGRMALRYSGREAAGGLVDYTQKKHVRRHPSGLPGKALYTDFKTMNIEGEG